MVSFVVEALVPPFGFPPKVRFYFIKSSVNLIPSRYKDLRDGLPGIATNLLVNRLRELETADVVAREEAPPPIATTLFGLTERGHALKPVLLAIGQWGAPLLAKRSRGTAFRAPWLCLPLRHQLVDHTPKKPPASIELRTGDESLTIDVTRGNVTVRRGPAESPDAVLIGTPQLVMAVLIGGLDLEAAKASGLRFEGSVAVLKRVRPKPRRDPH
jgi:DNA-binding HxlR family transcriptional regulator